MSIYFPQNIFTTLINKALPEGVQQKVKYLPGAMITGELLKDETSIGLIPTFDLLKHKEMFVSRSFGVSFEGTLCNSYLYFHTHGEKIENVYLSGDVTANEALGAKLILKELYNTEVTLNLLKNESEAIEKDLLLVGDKNFKDSKLINGVSFAEEIIEVLSLPYVNFVLASVSKSSIENFHKSISDTQTKIYNFVEKDDFGNDLPGDMKKIFKDGISSFICKLDSQDIEGIDQLLRLAFYHEIVQEIIELNYV